MDVNYRAYRTLPGDVLEDWQRGPRVVVSVLRGEDIHRFVDGRCYRGSAAERCAIYGGRLQRFEVKE